MGGSLTQEEMDKLDYKKAYNSGVLVVINYLKNNGKITSEFADKMKLELIE